MIIVFAQQNSKEFVADCKNLTLAFEHEIKHINTAEQLGTYLASLPAETSGILLLDPDLPEKESDTKQDYLQRLQEIRNSHPGLALLPIIPEEQPAMVRQILEIDIYYSLYKPLNIAEITAAIDRIYKTFRKKETAPASVPDQTPTLPATDAPTFHGMIGTSQTMRQLFTTIEKVAGDNYSTVLIRGESGTGKEMVARAIHAQSNRAQHNFVPVNCAAIPDDLLESELFGYTKGAFTGANTNKPGRIQFADNGTLFLDEIGDMKHALQAKLLRVIQEREFEPVGAFKSIPVNTRILAATHCDLETLVAEGRFREDLYYRLSVIPLHIPPLRNRTDDIPYLVNNFLKKYAIERGREPFSLSPQALAAVIHYPWRGNVRELENLVQQLTILAAGKKVELNDLPEKFKDVTIPEDFSLHYSKNIKEETPASPQKEKAAERPTEPMANDCDWQEGVDFNQLINKFETQLIIEAMRQTEGNKKEAAKLLNLKRTTLLEKIKKKEIDGLWEVGEK